MPMRASKDAQRRPERQPRLHHRRLHGAAPHGHRSTKAGASTPATPASYITTAEGYKERSTKAGASTPATLPSYLLTRRATRPLNEGRSVNPGYTWPCRRSTGHPRNPLNEGRSVNPGYTTELVFHAHPFGHAQRRPERQPRLHGRIAVLKRHADLAQRRPERQPRLHVALGAHPGRSEGRSRHCQVEAASGRVRR